jgi:hypothetical protein
MYGLFYYNLKFQDGCTDDYTSKVRTAVMSVMLMEEVKMGFLLYNGILFIPNITIIG